MLESLDSEVLLGCAIAVEIDKLRLSCVLVKRIGREVCEKLA